MKKAYLLALGLLAVPALADNNRGFYLGVGASTIDDRQDKPIDTTAIRAAEVFAGYKYNAALGVELRLGSGLKEGESKDGLLQRDIGSYQTLYYKPELVNDEAKLYALIGYATLHSSVNQDTAVPANKEISYSGTAYGIGIGFVINEQFNVNVEYKNPCDEVYNKPNTASLNFDYRF